jgi:uncharacterized protein (TIGR03792 family)
MVVEFLTFAVDPAEQDDWLQQEERHWSRFLERQDGFVKKEMWRTRTDAGRIHAVIWWESMDHWQAIPQAELDAVVEAMGPFEKQAKMVAYDLIRQC